LILSQFIRVVLLVGSQENEIALCNLNVLVHQSKQQLSQKSSLKIEKVFKLYAYTALDVRTWLTAGISPQHSTFSDLPARWLNSLWL
jgi:hypothetical protein